MITRSVVVQAPASKVWELVSDLPRMGALSPENDGGTWVKGATGPAVGARFRGRNRRGWRRWSTDVVVTRCTPGEEFAFEVTSVGLPVAAWSYAVEDRGSSCLLSESWQDRRGAVITRLGRAVAGVADRDAFTATSIDATLAAVRTALEVPEA